MNREILFRGKRTDNGEWIYGSLAICSGIINNGRAYISEVVNSVYFNLDGFDLGNFYQVDPSTVGQFTGLTDKDGKRIFEGDIVAVHWIGDEEDVECYEITDIRSLPKLGGSSIDWREVIGNICDKEVSE